jgi:hypothetical protein
LAALAIEEALRLSKRAVSLSVAICTAFEVEPVSTGWCAFRGPARMRVELGDQLEEAMVRGIQLLC